MQTIKGKKFSGERSLFRASNIRLIDALFLEGESPLKESENIEINHVTFTWKYPLWYSKKIKAENTSFTNEAHAGIWYTKEASFSDCRFEERKNFRHSSELTLKRCDFLDARETLWWCQKVEGEGLSFHGDYVGMGSSDLSFLDIKIIGNYPFDGAKRVHIKNSYLQSKDAFWNAEDILIEDSTIEGEYFGWNSKRVTLRRCKIISHQGFCYMDNVILEDCEMENSDLTFEYVSNADVTISKGELDLKNPFSGVFVSPSYRNVEFSDERIDKSLVKITKKGETDGSI